MALSSRMWKLAWKDGWIVNLGLLHRPWLDFYLVDFDMLFSYTRTSNDQIQTNELHVVLNLNKLFSWLNGASFFIQKRQHANKEMEMPLGTEMTTDFERTTLKFKNVNE